MTLAEGDQVRAKKWWLGKVRLKGERVEVLPRVREESLEVGK
jgi:predicted DNA-binding antitoxin AbrB/MazE fold protein